MSEETRVTDQIRKLTNKVELAGVLAEMQEIKYGTTQNGVPYINFRGAIQCGETPDYTVRFKVFVKSKKADGTDSKAFANMKQWAENAVSLVEATKNGHPELATMVDMSGYISDAPYVNSKGNLVEAREYQMQFVNDFKEYKARLDIEGMIHSITDETKDDEPTGRQNLRLISMDFFGNALDFKDIIIPENLVGPMEDNGFERGRTSTFYISLIPNTKAGPQRKGAIGETRVSDVTYTELVITGAEPIIDPDSEKSLSPALMKKFMDERLAKLDSIKAEGYKGTKNANTTAEGSARNGIGGVSVKSDAVKTVADIADDDFPF